MQGEKEVSTPLASSTTLKLENGSPPTAVTPYRQLIGALQYLSMTRPDIAFAVNRLFQFMHAPIATHWESLKRILRYLKGTLFHGLYLQRGSPLQITTFSDA